MKFWRVTSADRNYSPHQPEKHTLYFQTVSLVYYFALIQKLEHCYFCGFRHPSKHSRAFFQNLSCEHLFPFSLWFECSHIELQFCWFSVILRQLKWGSSFVAYISCQKRIKKRKSRCEKVSSAQVITRRAVCNEGRWHLTFNTVLQTK